MSIKLKVDGYEHLIRDTKSNAIVNSATLEYDLYMRRTKSREQNSDLLRNTVKEINNLKSELREIKNLLKEVTKK